MSSSPRILVLNSLNYKTSKADQIIGKIGEVLAQTGAEVRFYDLEKHVLPVMRIDDSTQKSLPAVTELRSQVEWSQGLLLITPEYHGNVSGALKNAFDFLYGELAGKTAAVIATTGGGNGDMSIVAARNSVLWCHGFVLPLQVALKPEHWEDERISAKGAERVERLCYDLARYAPLLHAAFEESRRLPGTAAGMGGYHPLR